MAKPGPASSPASGPEPEPSPTERSPFAHESEAEFARILDFYGVRWVYEPHTFPILWNLDGAVIESFAPDFWLPDLETYVELTTLRQSLVRKKNRKLRRLRELYPGVRIKLFYGRDFRALMLKYGKVGLIGEMSGTLGQVTPPSRQVGTVDSETPPPDRAFVAELALASPSTGAVIAEMAPRPRRRRRRSAVTGSGAQAHSKMRGT